MRSERLFEIVFILLNKKRTTAQELAKKFAVSIRTVYRDIDILSCAGIPVYTVQGTGGGIFIDETYTINKSIVTQEERFFKADIPCQLSRVSFLWYNSPSYYPKGVTITYATTYHQSRFNPSRK